ncbi:hypothetical protein FA13DRAFT_507035 [Coprinellus micaceus]|uniref:Uncharacterized protein n=1 Tax=Coprinellus micaceus TaxID=71717 RepID=A0A4Y7SBV1_COPMI|nr:hypothetical protein FA13DRAFT_507035 [Coprinellus micaceus]
MSTSRQIQLIANSLHIQSIVSPIAAGTSPPKPTEPEILINLRRYRNSLALVLIQLVDVTVPGIENWFLIWVVVDR